MCLMQSKAGQFVEMNAESLRQCFLTGCPSLDLDYDRTCHQSQHLHSQEPDRELIRPRLLQNYFAGSSLSFSWPPLVREAHRGRDVRYFV